VAAGRRSDPTRRDRRAGAARDRKNVAALNIDSKIEAATPRRQRPRLRNLGSTDGERRATALELFFDLVFVVAVAQLSRGLGNEITFRDALILAGLFVPVWWAWVGFTFYADRFDPDDVVHRVLVLAGMFAVAVLASAIPDVYDGETTAFVLAYALVRGLLVLLYVRAWVYVPEARPLVNVYLAAFTSSIVVWLTSLAFAAPVRYGFWAAALLIDLVTPLLSAERIRLVPIHTSHIPERLGLFTIIVFGETVLAVVIGTETVSWTVESGAVAALGFVIASALWWLYFDYVDMTIVARTITAGQVFLYAHLPLLLGLTALGAGVKLTIKATASGDEPAGAAWAVGGGLALAILAMALIQVVSVRSGRDVDVWLRVLTALLALAAAAFASALGPVLIVALPAAALVAQVAFELVGRHEHPPAAVSGSGPP
jgi:low temperature requirement protein LtrA